ncbi:MAG: hypothetical protein OER22_08925 [Gammaproteobacteria bacterium]|nr:hypothetical protein [Gammaproteobacteria bacterium]MDH3374440.1 hypothetical protein [Gammaproteobacteria bacterium]MDH3409376.1 hypothetical protein [Gammaproteobacteria bacterium]MDH3552721.1 hypothetical protein [Gammaproteobacteria bacterium]
MKITISCVLVAVSALFLAGTASADNYREVWSCELEDEKKIEEVQAANSKWLAWVRKNVNKDISSAVLTAVVGDQEGFLFVDTYPSLAVWAAAKDALDTDEGEALGEIFEGLFDCDENRLWKDEPTP